MISTQRMFRWIQSKIIMTLLFAGTLSAIYFVWYSMSPIWAFIVSGGDPQYEFMRSNLESAISDIEEERGNVESQILSNPYDKQTPLLVPYALRLQAKQRELQNQLLALEPPSIGKYLQLFAFALLENIFALFGTLVVVAILPDLWYYLRKKQKMKSIFSEEAIDKQDEFWFFHGRVDKSKYFKMTVKICLVLFMLSMLSFFVRNIDSNIVRIILLFISMSMTGLLVFQITLIVKRFHDLGKSGKSAWLLLIPLYNLYLGMVLFFKLGASGTNMYGNDPTQYAGIF